MSWSCSVSKVPHDGFFPKKSYIATSPRLPLSYFRAYGEGHTFHILSAKNGPCNSPGNVHQRGNMLARQTTHKGFTCALL